MPSALWPRVGDVGALGERGDRRGRLDEERRVPAVGGAPMRLAANDPAQCTSLISPGVYNTWPKWSPEARQAVGRTYYWLLFSSQRLGGIRQLFMTALVEQGGMLTSHGAVHLWNQAQDRQNHTPSWEYLELVQ